MVNNANTHRKKGDAETEQTSNGHGATRNIGWIWNVGVIIWTMYT